MTWFALVDPLGRSRLVNMDRATSVEPISSRRLGAQVDTCRIRFDEVENSGNHVDVRHDIESIQQMIDDLS